ncbi:hypothetical protein KAE70_02475 [Bartonella henselae]|uniref:hypothetical protein n=1 Tax=Bartonella henselae TaxID=38323 RepID=UPI000AF78360|nr:hypothetical protein [Bartonella henselae]UJM33389.1 hypothetical protein KAE70_02475 [Bartonella henselae]
MPFINHLNYNILSWQENNGAGFHLHKYKDGGAQGILSISFTGVVVKWAFVL